MNDKSSYITRFENVLPTCIRAADKSWYKNKFEWRIEFNFYSERGYGIDHRWGEMIDAFKFHAFVFRKRREGTCSIYTSELALLDFILADEQYHRAIVQIEYTSDVYLTELSTQLGIDAITDIKYVKNLTDYRYQVYLGNFSWRDPLKDLITAYLTANAEDFDFRGYYQEIINRCKKNIQNQWGNSEGVYDGFNFYAKSTDDILMLHMIAPGKIRKIIKVMEKTN